MCAFWESLFCVLVLIRIGGTSGQTPEHLLHPDEGNFSERMKQEPIHPQRRSLPGFNLRVQVNDLLSRLPLSQALVELFINYTKNFTALTVEDGGALLRVPYRSELPFTVVASRNGYTSAVLSCKTNRSPIFSSLTASLLRLNPGSIWLFEESVLITGKAAEVSSQPVVRFPQSLLNLTHSRNISSVKAFVTVPRQDESLNTPGVLITKSGYVSMELNPAAAVGVQLFSGDTELHVSGPIQISLGVPQTSRLQVSDVVPAWFFNRTTGGWMRKGLGKVTSEDGTLRWTFTAPHLGDWIAAPFPSTRGSFGLSALIEFIPHRLFFLMVFLGGTLLIVIGLLSWMIFYCRRPSSEIKASMTPAVMKKDQTTSTRHDEVPSDDQDQSETEQEENQENSDVMVNSGAVAISVELNEVTSDQTGPPESLTDSLCFYNQPVAILPASAFFHLEEEPDQADWSRSATLPRVGTSNGAATETQRKESFTQTIQNAPSATQSQVTTTRDQPGGSESSQTGSNTSRGPFSLPESASVPGTLNKIRGNRHSLHTFSGLSEIPSAQPPRAWFVSLEGKPAAEIRYAVSEQQRRRRPIESRDTSLDSGVDMSELNQTSSRRTVTLERNATFTKNTPSNKHTTQQ